MSQVPKREPIKRKSVSLSTLAGERKQVLPVTLRVPGKPEPQPRHSFQVRFPKGERCEACDRPLGRPFAFAYLSSSDPIHGWRNSVFGMWLRTTRTQSKPPTAKPMVAFIDIFAERPKSMVWKTRPMPREPDDRQNKGDCDNYAKAILDALNEHAYHDDSQVSFLIVRRWIAAGGEEPHAEIVLAEITPDIIAGLDIVRGMVADPAPEPTPPPQESTPPMWS